MTSRQTRSSGTEWIGVRDASTLLGVSAATLRRWGDSGEIRSFTTPGGHRRFSREALLALLPAERRERPTLATLGETPAQITRVYRRQLRNTAAGGDSIGSFAESERTPLRDLGRRLSAALLLSFDAATPAERERALAEADEAAAEQGRMAAMQGVPLRETVDLFLRFRLPFVRELATVACRRSLDTIETTGLLGQATEAFDRLLRTTMLAHETAVLADGDSSPRTGELR